ncbi:MAG: transcription factor FapR [Deltaproteobacteria bacterium]
MAKASLSKKERHQKLVEKTKEDPFLKDEELAELFSVSVQTIRLDRLELGIPELRERLKEVASANQKKIKSLASSDMIGEVIDLELGQRGIAILEATEEMVFERNKIVRGHYIYSLAETLAISVIDAKVAVIGVANIKYKKPVFQGDRLVAKADVKRIKADSFIVWVVISNKNVEVFRGKFLLKAVDEI